MRTTAILFSLLLCFAAGCDTSESVATATPIKLEVVNATTLEMMISAKPVILLDFTADW